jgi:hypothetical protein
LAISANPGHTFKFKIDCPSIKKPQGDAGAYTEVEAFCAVINWSELAKVVALAATTLNPERGVYKEGNQVPKTLLVFCVRRVLELSRMTYSKSVGDLMDRSPNTPVRLEPLKVPLFLKETGRNSYRDETLGLVATLF